MQSAAAAAGGKSAEQRYVKEIVPGFVLASGAPDPERSGQGHGVRGGGGRRSSSRSPKRRAKIRKTTPCASGTSWQHKSEE
jgi:hypothetical protein